MGCSLIIQLSSRIEPFTISRIVTLSTISTSKCNEAIIMVNNSHLFESQIIEPITSDDDSESGLLPGFGMFLTVLSLTIGLIYSTRRD